MVYLVEGEMLENERKYERKCEKSVFGWGSRKWGWGSSPLVYHLRRKSFLSNLERKVERD